MKENDNCVLEILLLGSFDIIVNGQSVLSKFGKSQKAMSLLKYFISNRGKKIPVSRIIDSNFKLYDYADYNNALRSQIHRLRTIIKEINLQANREAIELEFIAGNYIFKVSSDCYIDIDQFEAYAKQVCSFSSTELVDQDIPKIIKTALSLYRGEYIEGIEFCDWVFPLRQHYKRQYISFLTRYNTVLLQQERYDEVISECEYALSINFFEEIIHELLLQALYKSNKSNQALNHYNYVTSRFYTEMNMKPSEKMRSIYQKIQKKDNTDFGTDLFSLEKSIRQVENSDGVFFCDKDFFINLYRLEIRKKERETSKTMIGIFTITAYDLREITEEESLLIVEDIGRIIDKYMRKYDVITKLNSNQFAFIMYNSSEEMIKRINQRMNFLLNQAKKKHKIMFTLSCKPIQSTNEDYTETAF